MTSIESTSSASSAAAELPVHLTRFVGRDRELDDLARLVGASRLLTLTGAGGSGKTRLAREAALRAAGSFARVAWVDLAPLADAQLLTDQVAAALHVPERAEGSPTELLVGAIGGDRVLLVLDNCEHLVDACATLAEALLRACPRLAILATSREALGVASETAWLVPPLASDEAVQLFVGGKLVEPTAWGSARPRELLVYLLMHPEGRTKEQAGLAFCPDASPAQLRNSFHVTLHRLRKALGGADWITLANERYRVDPAIVEEFDVVEFERDVTAARRALKRQQGGGRAARAGARARGAPRQGGRGVPAGAGARRAARGGAPGADALPRRARRALAGAARLPPLRRPDAPGARVRARPRDDAAVRAAAAGGERVRGSRLGALGSRLSARAVAAE